VRKPQLDFDTSRTDQRARIEAFLSGHGEAGAEPHESVKG